MPFNDRKNGRKVATFVLGYRGYIQLAIRSGQYKKLIVTEIKDGELIGWDPLTEDIEIKPILDEERRKVTETIGYYAMFRYINGFEKVIYWPKEKMKAHALQYSAGYANDIKRGWTNTFWSKDFDSMAKKTMLRQLIIYFGNGVSITPYIYNLCNTQLRKQLFEIDLVDNSLDIRQTDLKRMVLSRFCQHI